MTQFSINSSKNHQDQHFSVETSGVPSIISLWSSAGNWTDLQSTASYALSRVLYAAMAQLLKFLWRSTNEVQGKKQKKKSTHLTVFYPHSKISYLSTQWKYKQGALASTLSPQVIFKWKTAWGCKPFLGEISTKGKALLKWPLCLQFYTRDVC